MCPALLSLGSQFSVFILGTLKNTAISGLGTSFYGAEEGWKQRVKGIGGLKVTSLAKWKLREVNRKTASSTSYYFRIGLALMEGRELCYVDWNGLLEKSGCLWFFWRSDNTLVSVWVTSIGVTPDLWVWYKTELEDHGLWTFIWLCPYVVSQVVVLPLENGDVRLMWFVYASLFCGWSKISPSNRL